MEDADSIYNWAQSSRVPELADWAFELYIRRVAESNQLEFYCTKYPAFKDFTTYYFQLAVKRGKALHAGDSANYVQVLDEFLQTHDNTYWYLAESRFPTIDAIFNYEKNDANTDASKKIGIAYLHATAAKTHSIDYSKFMSSTWFSPKRI